MPWPKTFPNAEHLGPTDPQWRPIQGRPGFYYHDDFPTQAVEIILHQCPICAWERQTMHSAGSVANLLLTPVDAKVIDPNPDHTEAIVKAIPGLALVATLGVPVSPKTVRDDHSICPQGHQMAPIVLKDSLNGLDSVEKAVQLHLRALKAQKG